MECGGFFCTCHEALLPKLMRYPAHMHVKVHRTRAIKSVVYGRNAENEPISRIKMADYRALVSMGTL